MTADLPNDWSETTLGELIDGFQAGRNLKANGHAAAAGQYGVLKISAVTWGEFNPAENKALVRGDKPKPHEVVRAGDLLISRANTSELVGAVVRVEDDHPNLMLPDKILRLVVNERKVDPDFLKYALRTRTVREHFEREATGTSESMRNLSQPKMCATPVRLAPRSQQRRIVEKIEALTAKSRRAKEALDAIPPLLERFRQSVLAAAFRGDLTKDWREQHPEPLTPDYTALDHHVPVEQPRRKKAARSKAQAVDPSELPHGWRSGVLSEVAEVQLGQRRAPEYVGEVAHPYIRAANITWRGLDLADVKSMGFASPESLVLRHGDVLLTEASGSSTEVGKPAIWRGEIENCCFQATVLRLRPRLDRVLPEWLYYSCLADARLGRFAAMAPGVGILHLTSGRMRDWPIALPTLEEQEVICDRLGRALAVIDAREASLGLVRTALGRLDASVLAKAFRGELTHEGADA